LPFMSALREVRDLLEGWISASRVIVTCRVNVWEASLNALDQFETYRIGQFSPEQLENFIKNWFAQSNPNQGRDLWQALNDGRNHRIQDLVKSPLRLTLLCSTWQEDSTLPETKAALYERFVAALYRWKSDRFSISRSDREKLDKSLGELAKAAIDRGGSAYRLTQIQVDEHLDDQTRNLCLALGWLNSLGDRNQEVYAFIHPTFQEYFAALSIEDGEFFFDPDTEEAHQRSYRIFDARWKEPLLIWFGFSHISKHDKDLLLRKLIYFEDQCGQFYEYRAIFIAASCLTEFPESEYKDEILDQVFDFAFGHPPDDENIINEDGNIIWLYYPITLKAEDYIFSGETLAEDSMKYICSIFEGIYRYTYNQCFHDDKMNLPTKSKLQFLKFKHNIFENQLLKRRFNHKAKPITPHGSPSFICSSIYFRIKQFPIQKDILKEHLISILQDFNNWLEDFHERRKLLTLIEEINDDLDLVWHFSDLLLSIDPSSKIGLLTIRRILFFSYSHENNALYTLYQAGRRLFADNDAVNTNDPILSVALYLFYASEYTFFDSNLLDAALIIASILDERNQSLPEFLKILYSRFPEIFQEDKILSNVPYAQLLKYVESCLMKNAENTISALESLRSYWNVNREQLKTSSILLDRDEIQWEIDKIKKGDSPWWRMLTKEEVERNTELFMSMSDDEYQLFKIAEREKKIALAKTDEKTFLDILSNVHSSGLSLDQMISLLNESRYSTAVRGFKRGFWSDGENKSMHRKYSMHGKYYFDCFHALYHCAENMPYEQFLAAWQDA